MSKLPDADLLEDLSSRFVLNVPATEYESFDRLMFLVEQAHWFYEDHCRTQDPALQSLSLKTFTGLLFEQCPGLQKCRKMLPQIYKSFNSFKSLVPTYGAILLDATMQKTLLVRGYNRNSTWGFPKGKISCNESEMACAIREVLEETSYDISSKIVESDFVEMHIGGRGEDGLGHQKCKLFIIQSVNTNESFGAKCKGEIGAYAWFSIADLPATAEAARILFSAGGTESYKMHGVYPFMKLLKGWIGRKRRKDKQQQRQASLKHPKSSNSHRNSSKGGDKIVQANGFEAGLSEDGSSPTNPAPNAGLVADESLTLASNTEQPGQMWLRFKLNREQVIAQLFA